MPPPKPSSGTRKKVDSAMENRCATYGFDGGIRTNSEPRGYEIMREKMSCKENWSDELAVTL